MIISIHTPTRGVTNSGVLPCLDHGNFNPHSHKGSDYVAVFRYKNNSHFNPHSHKGSDRIFEWLSTFSLLYFNPHSHKGSDITRIQAVKAIEISIHTPTRGVTASFSCSLQTCRFQSTLPQGEWRYSLISFWTKSIFQSTLPQGEWQVDTYIKENARRFQSTLPQGEWPLTRFTKTKNQIFQSTLPQGEWRTDGCRLA